MSKRGMDIQGGADRYGGGDGPETPTEAPRQATAAQMARRKIATIKRPSRATSPNKTAPSFGGFGQQQPAMNAQPQQTSFSFGQNGTNGTSSSNSFAFGQSQPASNGGFAFGQSQGGSASNSFTFGQQGGAQSGGFNFNAGNAVSFPGANGTNAFSNTNGQSGAGTGFSGSIFNIPGSTNSLQQTQLTNGFSFTSHNASTAPSTPSNSFGANDADKKEIEQREPYLNSEQQKRLEEIVGKHLPDSPSAYQQAPLELLPQEVVSQVAQYVRSLHSPGPGSQRSATALFSKPCRAKSKKTWVTDAERGELKAAAPNLTPEQQSKLTQIVKDNVEPLRFKSDNELPSFEYLPNDVQREMLDFVRKPAGDGTSTPSKPANPFTFSASATPEPQAAASPATEQSKTNPFASIKSATASPAPPSTPFSFGQAKASTPAQSSLPSFSFGKPTETPAAAPSIEKAPSDTTSDDTPAKSNPFAAVSRSKSPSFSPSKAQDAGPKNTYDSANTNGINAGFKSTPFQSAPNTDTTSTPTKPPFTFGAAKTPAPASNNIFNASSAPAPPATAPAQKSTFTQPTTAAPPKPVFDTAQSTSQPAQPQAKQTVSVPSTYVPAPSDSLITLVAKTGLLNACFRSHIKKLETYADWSAPVGYYLQELEKLKVAIRRKEKEEDAAGRGLIARAAEPPLTGKPPAAQPLLPPSTGKRPSETFSGQDEPTEDSPAKRQKATPGFQISSPSKPLSNTANIFNSILSSPDKPAGVNGATSTPATSTPFKFQPPNSNSTAAAQQSPSSNAPTFSGHVPGSQPFAGLASPFKPNPSPAAQKAPVFQVPKFGGGGASSNNFMSAFGAKAAKEAEKEKEKRKAEDFDSDEDDEAEWERKDREEQEEKKRKLAESAKKVMKMVDGKMVWVDKDQGDAAPGAAKSKSTSLDSPAKDSGPAPTPSNPFSFLSRPTSNDATNKALPSAPQEGAEDDDEDEENRAPSTNGTAVPTTPAKTGGLFDRVTKNTDGSLQKDQTTVSKPLFSFSTTSPAGDNTWKPETPIKFGNTVDTPGSTTPSGSPAKSLFSFPSNTTSQPSANLPKFNFGGLSNDNSKQSIFSSTPSAAPSPGVGFKFGNPPATSSSLFPTSQPGSSAPSIFSSAPGSRATTPGATTADEGSTAANTDNEEDAAPPEEQKDLTSLSAEEIRTEDVLFEQKARCRKFVRGGESPWENKGVGIVRLLKNKESGNPRVLMRLAPGGQILINANLLKDRDLYSNPNEKTVKLVFAEGEGDLTTYMLTFGKKESADDLLGKIQGA
ncbi:RanBP1 domain-containing protein 3 [Elsinoe fawcettii]|nr:RanBP1 domain-containing protein 3 [Elsinoe fawcettii]